MTEKQIIENLFQNREKILIALINNKITTNTILEYMNMVLFPYGWFEHMLAKQVYTLLKEIHTISGIPARFEHIDRHYYEAAIKLLEKEGKVKTYGSVVQLIPTLEDRKKLLIERISKAQPDLITTFEMTLDDYDRG